MKEFIEFLGSQSPYDRLDPDDLARLAGTVEVEFFSAGEWVIAEGAASLDHLFVVRTGSVEVIDHGKVVDVLGPGDTFGHISVFSGLPPPLAVKALEETLCYRMPDPRKIVTQPDHLQFSHYNGLVARQRQIESGGAPSRFERSVVESMRPLLWCRPDETVRQAARLLTERRQSAAVLRIEGSLGIVTDDDFRREVATGNVGLDEPVARIASLPAASVSSDSTVWATYLKMVDRGVHHMVVSTPAGRPIGIVGVIDLIATDIRHPLVVRRAIAEAKSMAELAEACRLMRPTMAELWDAEVTSTRLAAVRAAMVEAAFRRILELGEPPAGLETIRCSWLLLGSMGRGEPLPNSGIETAFMWQPREASGLLPAPERLTDAAAARLQAATGCGLEFRPDKASASNPLYNRSADQWRQDIARWTGAPHDRTHMLLASALLDARPITGHRLGRIVQDELEAAAQRTDFVQNLTRFALADKPPAGFVRGFVVESVGERRPLLDLEQAGLRPVVSLARVLALRAGDASGTTPQRLERAAAAGFLTKEEYETLQGTFWLYLDILFEQEIEDIKTGQSRGTCVVAGQLDPLRRRHLRDGFRAIERIQDRVGSDRRIDRP